MSTTSSTNLAHINHSYFPKLARDFRKDRRSSICAACPARLFLLCLDGQTKEQPMALFSGFSLIVGGTIAIIILFIDSSLEFFDCYDEQ